MFLMFGLMSLQAFISSQQNHLTCELLRQQQISDYDINLFRLPNVLILVFGRRRYIYARTVCRDPKSQSYYKYEVSLVLVSNHSHE